MQELARAHISIHDSLVARITSKQARIGVLGLGYVGLPLAVAFARNGFQTIGLDADERKTRSLNEGRSYIGDVSNAELRREIAASRLHVDTDPARLACSLSISSSRYGDTGQASSVRWSRHTGPLRLGTSAVLLGS